MNAQNLIVSKGALPEIGILLENCIVPGSNLNHTKFKVALIGLLLNLVAENESIHKQVG